MLQEILNPDIHQVTEIPNVIIERPAHLDFKKIVPDAIGLIRTGDTTAYENIILESV